MCPDVLEMVSKKLELMHSSALLGSTHTHYFLRTVKCRHALVKKMRDRIAYQVIPKVINFSDLKISCLQIKYIITLL